MTEHLVTVSGSSLKRYWDNCVLENRALILEDIQNELGVISKHFDFNSALSKPFDELPKPVARMVESRMLSSLMALNRKL